MNLEELEIEKTRLLGLIERVHQVNDPLNQEKPEHKFVSQEVPKMQYMENLRTQLVYVEREINKLKRIQDQPEDSIQ